MLFSFLPAHFMRFHHGLGRLSCFRSRTFRHLYILICVTDITSSAEPCFETLCIHQCKHENKFQSQNNHESFNCLPSKSNPHSINQKSVSACINTSSVLTAQMPHRTIGMTPTQTFFITKEKVAFARSEEVEVHGPVSGYRASGSKGVGNTGFLKS